MLMYTFKIKKKCIQILNSYTSRTHLAYLMEAAWCYALYYCGMTRDWLFLWNEMEKCEFAHTINLEKSGVFYLTFIFCVTATRMYAVYMCYWNFRK